MEQKFLIELLKEAVSPFQCVEASVKRLKQDGFEEITYEEKWNLKLGGKYVLNHHGTTLYAFTVGENYHTGDMVRMAAAHTDYPCMRIKPNPDFRTEAYAQVNVEVYGGPILNTWFDRPLGVAGRVVLRSEDVFAPRTVLYRSQKAVLTIPNLAIHMNREVNKGVEINNQVDLMPILDVLPKEETSTDYFLTFLAEELAVDKEDILDFELNTYCMEEPAYVGVKDTFLSSPRLDNQTSVAALLQALMRSCGIYSVCVHTSIQLIIIIIWSFCGKIKGYCAIRNCRVTIADPEIWCIFSPAVSYQPGSITCRSCICCIAKVFF